MENKCADSTKPSALQAVKDLLKSKDQLHQKRLAGGDLAARDARLITVAHVATALTLCLDQPKGGMVLRAELLLQVALAGRNSDCRQPLYKHLALRHYANLLPGALDVANDAIGPHFAVALIFNCAVSKSAKGGVIENRSAVRYLHPDFCPVGATADYVIWDLTQLGRLCEENLLHCHLLRSPSSTGRQVMGDTELGKRMKKLLKDSGVKCDRTILPGGKHETTQGLKKLFGALCHLQNLDFTDQQLAMGHDRSTTEQSYLFTMALRTMFSMAGHGERFRTQHHLGRSTVQPSAALLALALPGLDELAPRLAENPELESIGEVLQFLRVVFLQDAALKAKREGLAYAGHFPQLEAVMAHEAWPAFAADVEARHQEGLRAHEAATAARDTSAVAVLQERNKQLEERLRQEEERSARQAGRIEELLVENARVGGEQKRRRPESEEESEPAAQRQRVGDPADKQQPVEEPTPSGLTFVLKDFQTVGQAWEAYEAIAVLPRRWWQGDKKQRTKHATAFGRLGTG